MNKRVLIVIDFQNDFVEGALGFEGAELLDEVIAQKVRLYRQDEQDIIVTYDTHQENYLHTTEGRHLPVPHCIRGTEGWKLYGKTGQLLETCTAVFEKPAFGSLPLGNFLRAKQYQSVELCGLVSNICVISNAVIAKAALPEAEIIVDASATASFSPELHQYSLEVMKGLHITITEGQEIL